jgi:hypothetical protein
MVTVPSLEHLRVLGAASWKVPKPQGKLMPRGQHGIMLGFMSDERGK